MSAKEQEGYDRNAALDTLSPEERAAIEDDGLDEEERDALQNIAGEDDGDGSGDGENDADDDEGEDEDEGQDDADGSDESADAGEGEDDADDQSAAQASDDEEDDIDAAPVYAASLPEDFEDRVKALNARTDEIAEKFKAGDISADEFISESNKISAERAELDGVRTEARIAARMNEQNAAHQWRRAVKGFMKEVKASEGIDYAGKPLLNGALDIKVKELAAAQENADKPASWFLKEAHRQVKEELGLGAAKKGEGGGQKKGEKARKPPTAALPKTLAQVPGGDGPGDVGGDEFAELDRLTGEAYEMALAKLSPAQRQRYLEQV